MIKKIGQECVRWALYSIVALVLTGCHAAPPYPDRSSPSDSEAGVTPSVAPTIQATRNPTQRYPSNPCSPPCWYNIVPGETGPDEALKIIVALPFVTDYWTEDRDTGRRVIRWLSEDGDEIALDGGVIISGDRVVSIFVNDRAERATAGEIIERYGPPARLSHIHKV